MSNTNDSDTPARTSHPSRAALGRVRETLTAELAAYEQQAAEVDESLEYRRGVADAAALVAELLGKAERDDS